MTDTSYLYKYFLENSPQQKDSGKKDQVLRSNDIKKRESKEEDEKHE